MKNLIAPLALASLFTATSFAALEHRVGNGGDELELTLKHRILQIGAFVNSTVGKKEFRMINSEALNESINQLDLVVSSDELRDRFDTVRTCINVPETLTITCNAEKINQLIQTQNHETLTALLFHELLGVNKIELGYENVVSSYPISSKIIPYTKLVIASEISEKSIRPEFYGLDNKSYGVTYVNKATKETLRMICLNDNVEVHRCKNFTIVRSLNGMQTPLFDEQRVITKREMKSLNFNLPSEAEFAEIEQKLKKARASGYDYLTLKRTTREGDYVIGVINLAIDDSNSIGSQLIMHVFVSAGIVSMIVTVPNLAAEGIKHVGNLLIWPFKSIMNGVKIVQTKNNREEIQKKLDRMKNVMNINEDLSLINRQVQLSHEDFNLLGEQLKMVMRTLK